MDSKIDTCEFDSQAVWRMRGELFTSDPMPLQSILWGLISFPFSCLEFWNGHSWEVVWNGAVEFEGVAP